MKNQLCASLRNPNMNLTISKKFQLDNFIENLAGNKY